MVPHRSWQERSNRTISERRVFPAFYFCSVSEDRFGGFALFLDFDPFLSAEPFSIPFATAFSTTSFRTPLCTAFFTAFSIAFAAFFLAFFFATVSVLGPF